MLSIVYVYLLLTMLSYGAIVHRMVRHLDERTAAMMGRAGARKRAQKLSKAQRTAIARKAAAARWSKKRAK